MYAKISKRLLPLFLLVSVLLSIGLYYSYQEKKRLAITVENQYQHAFHELSNNIEKVQQELGHTIVLNPEQTSSYRKSLAQTWRYAHIAKNNLESLPLGLMPVHDTEQFLANLANLTYQVSMREANDQPMDAKEVNTLHLLYQHSTEISEQLRQVQQHILQKNLRWTEAESILSAEEEVAKHDIIDGFSSMNQQVSSYTDIEWGRNHVNPFRVKHVSQLSNEQFDITSIKQKAKKFLGEVDDAMIHVQSNGRDIHGYESYDVSVQYPTSKSANTLLNYSKRGGELMYFLHHREIGESRISPREARDFANAFLDQHGYKHMAAVHFDRNQQIASLVFVKKQKDTLIYPQQISVQVALDDGEVIAMNAAEYVFSRQERKIEPMKLSVQDAQRQLSKQVQVTQVSQAIIENDEKQEVACYEFWAKLNQADYRIFINGQTGVAEKIESVRARSDR